MVRETTPNVTSLNAKKTKERPSARDFFPQRLNLTALRSAAAECRGCHLWKVGTQTVFGEGPRQAKIVLVGEQPGDVEDRTGHPFSGPAGRLLNEVLADLGIERDLIYVTNAVKHFKWEASGKRRIHKKPNETEVRACIPWLHAEFKVLKPEIIVCLGSTATQAILGKEFRVTECRGRFFSNEFAEKILVTVHPSSLLRNPSPEMRRENIAAFKNDLNLIVPFL